MIVTSLSSNAFELRQLKVFMVDQPAISFSLLPSLVDDVRVPRFRRIWIQGVNDSGTFPFSLHTHSYVILGHT